MHWVAEKFLGCLWMVCSCLQSTQRVFWTINQHRTHWNQRCLTYKEAWSALVWLWGWGAQEWAKGGRASVSSIHGAGRKTSLGSAAVEFTKVLYALSPCLSKVPPSVLSSDPHPHLPSAARELVCVIVLQCSLLRKCHIVFSVNKNSNT